MKGAVTPDYFLANPDWLDFALMSESVENEIANPPKGGPVNTGEQDTVIFNIIPPEDDKGGAPAHVRA